MRLPSLFAQDKLCAKYIQQRGRVVLHDIQTATPRWAIDSKRANDYVPTRSQAFFQRLAVSLTLHALCQKVKYSPVMP
jgi:hypothetical protein